MAIKIAASAPNLFGRWRERGRVGLNWQLPPEGRVRTMRSRNEDICLLVRVSLQIGSEIEYTFYMRLRYNYRLYPTPGQRAALAKAFGCARVVFNDGLRARQEARAAGLPYLTDADLSARLTAAKATPERAWLGEASAVVLQQGTR